MNASSKVLQLLCCVVAYTSMGAASDVAGFRPPAVPLVTCNPYFSVWSFADRLTYDATRHWTGAKQELHSLVRANGATWRPFCCCSIPNFLKHLWRRFSDMLNPLVGPSPLPRTILALIRLPTARSVVGGLFIKMLADSEDWKRWAGRRFK